ncbi:uncharacterized protein LOC132933653 isoform X2 [Metopolophium dirhodum]|uniref:uncharacterized protein LOC132933653 isoform X2 n=1 Tax=Metopolophium dirhodum TaxID=44670 RepID=UPI00298F5505|nr:uncharacterized protein LOC132933653 isoform X2 [Metopolophium dirhodum]
MPIIINFLVITIVFLTIFVKMVPAPGEDDEDEYSKNMNLVTNENFNKFKDLYTIEIREFCIKQNILGHDTTPDEVSANALLYLKYSFNDFSRINWLLDIGSNVYINFLIWRKENKDDLNLKGSLTQFKDLTNDELKTMYENITFSSLPNEIEEQFFLGQFKFIYDISNIIQVIMGKGQMSAEKIIENLKKGKESKDKETNRSVFTVKKGKESTDKEKNGKESTDKVPFDTYSPFKERWEFFDFNEDIFKQYNSNKDATKDICTDGEINYKDNGETKTMKMFDAFLHFFKESLDNNYNMTLHMDINGLEQSQQTAYYENVLKGMKNIYDEYCVHYGKPKINTITDLVQKMVDVAEQIKQNSNITMELDVVAKQIQNNSNVSGKNDGFEVSNHRYTSCYRINECGLPDKVNFRVIFQIVASVKHVHDAYMVPAITKHNSGTLRRRP